MRRPTQYLPRRAARRLAPLLRWPAVLLLIALVPGTGPVPRPPGWPGSSGLYLVISEQHLEDIRAVAPKLAAVLLARRTTIVLSPRPAALTGSRAALGTAFFTSYADFIGRLRRRALPAAVRAVAYDPELWPATPPAERLAPRRYLALFAAAAGRHGYPVMLMPGRDLLAAAGPCRQQPREDLDAAFLRCGLAGESARLSQVFEIQTAPVETRASELRAFAAACARQARAANPAVVLIATLSTQPGTLRVSGGQLARAAAAVRPFVQGFQLNMTRRSTRAAVAFLRTIPALRG